MGNQVNVDSRIFSSIIEARPPIYLPLRDGRHFEEGPRRLYNVLRAKFEIHHRACPPKMRIKLRRREALDEISEELGSSRPL